MAWPKAVIYGATVGVTAIVTVGTIIGGIAATKVLLVGGVEQQITRLENNIPSKVKEGVRDALVEDKVVRIEVNAIIDDQLKELIEKNNAVLADLRAEMTKSRESLTQAIKDQTERLSGDLGRLEGELSNVRFTQNILLKILGAEVPVDPKAFWQKGLWREAPYHVAPMWVIDQPDYDLMNLIGLSEKVLYRMEAVKGPPE